MKIEHYLAESPVFALYRAQSLLVDTLQRELAKEGVHFLQGLILTACFFESKELRPRDFAQVFRVSNSNLSHALRDLERKKYLRRSLHREDARGYLFQITPHGRKKALSLMSMFNAIQSEMEVSLGVRSFRDFVAQLDAMTNVVRERYPSTRA